MNRLDIKSNVTIQLSNLSLVPTINTPTLAFGISTKLLDNIFLNVPFSSPGVVNDESDQFGVFDELKVSTHKRVNSDLSKMALVLIKNTNLKINNNSKFVLLIRMPTQNLVIINCMSLHCVNSKFTIFYKKLLKSLIRWELRICKG